MRQAIKRKIPEEVIQSRDQWLEISRNMADFLNSKKAEDIKLLYLEGVNPYFRYIMIVTATSATHLKSLVKELQRSFGSYLPEKNSGFRSEDLSSGWVILDFIDLVVHIFTDEERSYYNLERLWGDADEISLELSEPSPSEE